MKDVLARLAPPLGTFLLCFVITQMAIATLKSSGVDAADLGAVVAVVAVCFVGAVFALRSTHIAFRDLTGPLVPA